MTLQANLLTPSPLGHHSLPAQLSRAWILGLSAVIARSPMRPLSHALFRSRSLSFADVAFSPHRSARSPFPPRCSLRRWVRSDLNTARLSARPTTGAHGQVRQVVDPVGDLPQDERARDPLPREHSEDRQVGCVRAGYRCAWSCHVPLPYRCCCCRCSDAHRV
jgi:hypothetical protein